MFPQFEPQLNNTDDEKTTNGKSFLFDFITGDFVIKDGKLQVIQEIEALKVWIIKILKTEKHKFKIYETNELNEYGTTILELINSGQPQFFIQAEIQREVTESLLGNKEISSIENFTFNRDKRILIVNFTVRSIYGAFIQEVMF